MKLITPNIWGGKIHQPFLDFLKKYQDVDIFCFQEVYNTNSGVKEFHGIHPNIFQDIKDALPEFDALYAPAQEGVYDDLKVDFDISFGLAMFVKKSITVEKHEDIFVFRSKNAKQPGEDSAGIGRNLEHIVFNTGVAPTTNDDDTSTSAVSTIYSIFNLHGLWNGKGKSDTEDRLNQSMKTKEFMKNYSTHKTILCGDFNLMPDTESLAILETGMKNLVKEYGVTSTRSSLYPKPLKFADYILVSPDIVVKDFKVLPDEVSDHMALYVDFE